MPAAMREVDVAIIGGGLAGSSAAVMLGRSDLDVALIDPNAVYRPDFRCEKLDPSQVALLRRMGLAGLVLPRTTRSATLWVARLGRLIDRAPIDQYGILYHDLVNAVRAGIPASVTRVEATIASIEPGEMRRIVRLSNGEAVSARLVVLANGLNWALRRSLGITCEVLSPAHSTTIGFDVVPAARGGFAFDSLTYFGERPQDRTAYLTLFKLGPHVRANLMTYRRADDPWLADFRNDPKAALLRLMPGLAGVTGAFEILPPLRVRPADLYVAREVERPGIVLVGDAFATSCPAAGTGTNKVLRDVERLCGVHIPSWFAQDDVGVDKIAAFYADAEKQAEDLRSLRAAFALKSLTLDPRLGWRAKRYGRFAGRLLKGVARRVLAARPSAATGNAALPPSAAFEPERAHVE